MDLQKHIEENYGTRYKFAIDNKIQLQTVYYWCSKPWEELSYKTKKKILGFVDLI